MSIRVGSYNLENLFTRPTAMVTGDSNGQRAIEDHALANAIVGKFTYSDNDKKTLLDLDRRYHFSALSRPTVPLLTLTKVRGQLFRRSAGVVSISADGRGDWTGWFDLRREDAPWQRLLNIGRVIETVKPDILVCVEVENRQALKRFNEQVLAATFGRGFSHAMVLDGNDTLEMNIGILSRYPIIGIRSHVDDALHGERVFTRDCPVYVILLPSNEQLVVCPNHFETRAGQDEEKAKARRLAQGRRAAEISISAERQISPLVLVAGDLNDTPESPTISALIRDGWADIQSHPDYPTDRPGTRSTGDADHKTDYLIMSRALRKSLLSVGIERRGSYQPKLWPSFEGITATTEASDHHCIWADFDPL